MKKQLTLKKLLGLLIIRENETISIYKNQKLIYSNKK